MSWDFELVAGPYGSTTDGPAWDGEALLFTHVGASRILRYDPRSSEVTELRRWTNRTSGLAFSASGVLYGCQSGSRRIVRFNPDGSTSLLAEKLGDHLHNQPYDLVVDQQGRIWFSDPHGSLPASGPQVQGPLDHASVLRLEKPLRDWTIQRMTYDTTVPSGVLLSQDERTLYVAENSYEPHGSRELRAYPILEDGTLGSHTLLHTFGSDYRGVHRGIAGMCLDSEGNIIACAGWDRSGPGPTVYVFAPSGRVLESHAVPADRPTNCTFGDSDLRTLYVTTDEGHLYRVRNTGRQGWLLYPPAR
ncbi:MAG: SMP-30/gluconolactonase/LRE family protein [Dehalococcoidia bacterium]